MITIHCGGVGKSQVKQLIDKLNDPSVKGVVSSDMTAGPILKRDAKAFYIGTCHTGAGGSLGALLALVGRDKCHTFGRNAGSTNDEIKSLVQQGVKVFGLSVDQVDTVVPRIVQVLKELDE